MTQEFRIVKVKGKGWYAIVDQDNEIIANPIAELDKAKLVLKGLNSGESTDSVSRMKDALPSAKLPGDEIEDVTEASEKLYRTHFEDGEWFVVDQDGEVVETATDRREAIAIAADLNTGDSDTAVKVHQGSSYGNSPDTEIDESEESGKSYTMIVGKSGNSGMTDNNPNQYTKKRTVKFTATDWDSAKEKINSLIKPGEYVLNLYDDSSDEFGSSQMNEGDNNTKTATDRLKDIYAPQGATIGHDGTVSIGDYDVVVGNGLRGNDEVISIYKTDTEQDTLIKQFDVGSSSDQDIENAIFRAIKRDGGKYLTNSIEKNSMNEAFEKLTDKQLQDKFVDLKIKAKDLGKDSKESKQLQKIRDEIAKRKAAPKTKDLKEAVKKIVLNPKQPKDLKEANDKLFDLDDVKTAGEDVVDTISFDVPALIRLMEISREEIESDDELHELATSLIEKSKNGTLTIADLETTGKATGEEVDESGEQEVDEGIKLFNSSTDLTKLTDKQLQDMFIHVKTKSNDAALLQKIRDERAKRKTAGSVEESFDIKDVILTVLNG